MATMQDTQVNYVPMENVLQRINSKYISLSEEDKKRNNKILDAVTKQIENKMQDNALFKKMFRNEKYFGGSYYDGLKVGKPEEYDLDLLLELPPELEPTVEVSDKPGFVHLVLNNTSLLNLQGCVKKAQTWPDMLANMLVKSRSTWNLSTFKLLSWFEKVLDTSLKVFKLPGNDEYVFDINLSENEIIRVKGKFEKAFPAFTLKLKCNENITLDIDLVPCFVFGGDMWPKGNFRANPCPLKNKFLVVPKNPHGVANEHNGPNQLYWRLSFQEQEREIISGNQYNTLKATIKLLKKIRDKKQHKIASYYIKTIFLWEVGQREPLFWRKPLSIVFMEMLKKYENVLRQKCIPYYWHSQYNLLEHLKDITVDNIANYIKGIIDNVDRKISKDPFIIATYIMSSDEVEELKESVRIGKKYKPLDDVASNDTTVSDDQLQSIHTKLDEINDKIDLICRSIQDNNTLFRDHASALRELTVRVDNLERAFPRPSIRRCDCFSTIRYNSVQ